MSFKHLHIANWRQFRELDIEFHERLTIITGANGAGKTTILNLLSRHFGWSGVLVSTPRRHQNQMQFGPDFWTDGYLKEYEYWLESRSIASRNLEFDEPPAPPAFVGPQQEIGALSNSNGAVSSLTVPPIVGASFQITIHNQQPQAGMHIPSHRPIYSYQSVENIPTVPRRRDQAFSAYTDIVRTRYYGGHHHRTPNYYMKETLIALGAFGYGNEVINRDQESLQIFLGFESVLRTILPPTLGFQRLAIRLPEIVLITRTGDFSLDAVSGGIASLIDLAWQIFMYAPSDTPFTVTIDEPENHLHPELQRTVLSTLLTSFPHVQFICASHNPFIVTSVPSSSTYALRYGTDHRVNSDLLTSVDRSGTSNEILRDVLGLPSSSPMWVETQLRDIENQLLDQDLTPELITTLQERLTELGLQKFVPTALARLAKERLRK